MRYSSFTYGTTVNIKAMSGFAGQLNGSGGSGGRGGRGGDSDTSLTTTGGTSPYYQPGSKGGNSESESSDGIDLSSNLMNQTLYSKILTYTRATGITSGKGGGGAGSGLSGTYTGRGGQGFPNCKIVTTSRDESNAIIGGIACGGGSGGGSGGKGYAYIYFV